MWIIVNLMKSRIKIFIEDVQKHTSVSLMKNVFLQFLLKRRIYYREQSGKGFKARLAVTEKDLEKYLESWDLDGDLLGFYCFQMFS